MPRNSRQRRHLRNESMIPKSGNRFSDKIMLKTKNLDRDPIQLNWITAQSCAVMAAGGRHWLRARRR
jgi:hypothetical protein